MKAIEYKDGNIEWNYQTYNCSDATDMEIFCDKLNNDFSYADRELYKLRAKFDLIGRLVDNRRE